MRIIFNTLCSVFPFLLAWFVLHFFGETAPLYIIFLNSFFLAVCITHCIMNFSKKFFWWTLALINLIFMVIFMKIWFTGGYALEYLEQLMIYLCLKYLEYTEYAGNPEQGFMNFIITYGQLIISGGSAFLFALAVIIANVSAFALCRKYGIPFRLTAFVLRDAYNILVEMFWVCLAILLPLLFLLTELPASREWRQVMYTLVILSLCVGFFYYFPLKHFRTCMYKRQKAKSFIAEKSKIKDEVVSHYTDTFFHKTAVFLSEKGSIIAVVLVFLITMLFSGTLFYIQENGVFFLSILVFFGIIFTLGRMLYSVIMKLSGEAGDLFTFSKDGREYLAILRYDKERWVSVSCEILREQSEMFFRRGLIVFNKGELFIEKTGDMSDIKTRESSEYFFNVKKEKD